METFLLIYAIIGLLFVLWTNESAQKAVGFALGVAFVLALWPVFVGGGIGVSVYEKLKK